MIDSHVHLDDEAFNEDREDIIKSLGENGIELVINNSSDLPSSERSVKLANKYENIYAAIGVHPHEASFYNDEVENRLIELSKNKKVVAIGEIGLDYYYDFSDRETQKRVFIRQLELAREVDLPIIIHDRDAHGDIMNILRNEGKDNWGIFHCYSGSWEMAKEAIKMGFYISFAGPVVFPKSTNLKEVARQVPLERILIETDSPYLTPPPFRGRRNDPSKTQFVAEEIASLKGLDVDEFCEIAFNNGKRVFGIE